MKMYRIAKVSNYQDLLSRAEDEFHKNFNESDDGDDDFNFEIEPIDIKKKCGKIWVWCHGLYPSYAIDVPEGSGQNNSCASFRVETSRYFFNYDTQEHEKYPREELLALFLHEISHVSQMISGFTEHEYKRIRNDNNLDEYSQSRYYWQNHGEYKTEQEASFVQLCRYIQDNPQTAIDSLNNRKISKESLSYFSSNKTFAQKAYYLGVPKNNIVEFISLLPTLN
jgi:hypothetical protein